MKNILYDIENYNDFYDSLHIMETMEDESFKLIFMEFPRLFLNTKHIYGEGNYYFGYHINSDFFCKCLTNARRLLSNDGTLALFTPNISYSDQNYDLIINQFFPSMLTKMHTTKLSHAELESKLYFCSKQKNFIFPNAINFHSSEIYPYRDTEGKYRIISLTSPNFSNDFSSLLNCTSNEDIQNLCTSDNSNELWNSNKLIVSKNESWLKIYQHHEKLPIEKLFECPASLCHNPNVCDQNTLDRILGLFSSTGTSVFCPFDYNLFFPDVAYHHGLNWTSISIKLNQKITKLKNFHKKNNYSLITTLPSNNLKSIYRDDILTNALDITNLKSQIKRLTTSITSLKSILQIPTEADELFTETSKEIIAEKLHIFITNSISLHLLDHAKADAQNYLPNYWNELEPDSQHFLQTAMLVKKQLDPDIDIDFSTILIELCKTLETELYAKIFLPYATQIKNSKNHFNIQKYKNSDSPTQELAQYIYRFLNNMPRKIELGPMRTILEKAQSPKRKSYLINDFYIHLHNTFNTDFFSNVYIEKIIKITHTRNECIHGALISYDTLVQSNLLIKELITHLLKNLKTLNK